MAEYIVEVKRIIETRNRVHVSAETAEQAEQKVNSLGYSAFRLAEFCIDDSNIPEIVGSRPVENWIEERDRKPRENTEWRSGRW